jgi:putative ABC transport system permease protein
MKILLRTIYESIVQAVQQLTSNKLRTFLSLLGITIGIVCIIGVQSAVDSLQDNVMSSLKKLGDDVVYVTKQPWNEDPNVNFWKYLKRPNPDYNDYEAIKTKVKTADLAAYDVYIGIRTLKYRSNSVERVFCLASTYDFSEIYNVEFEKGRYYTPTEYYYAMNKVLIGHEVAEKLFGTLEPIGKKIIMNGRDLEVIGVFKKSGKDIIKIMNFDNAVMISYELAKKIANVKAKNVWGTGLNVKAVAGISTDQLKGDLTMALRAERKLKPKEENNFSLNTLSILANLIGQFFSVLNMVGWVIGGFAILVGIFSVANIMFVSVKERTNVIGIKKALGAKQSIILTEFLIESVILCAIGGLLGLAFVWLILKLLTGVMEYDVYLSWNNILFGVGLSVIVGIISGVIPALQAARMNPVDAIRHST